METTDQWDHFNSSEPCPVPVDSDYPTTTETQELKHWDHMDQIACNLLNKCLPNETMLEVQQYPTVKERWDVVKQQFTVKSAYAWNALYWLFINMQCLKGGDVCAFLSSLMKQHNKLLVASITIGNEDFEYMVLDSIPDPLATYTSQFLGQAHLNGKPLEMRDIIHLLSEEVDRIKT